MNKISLGVYPCLLIASNFIKRRGGDEHLNKKEKEDFIEEMKGRLQKAHATFLVDYKGLDVDAMNSIRAELRKSETEFRVVKNRLLNLASLDTDTSSLKEYFKGPCALAITYDDVVAPAKALMEESKKSENLNIKVGQISGKIMDLEGIKRLAELPSREVLLAQVLSTMQAVPSSFVRVLNGVLVKFLNVLKAIESQKSEGGAA
jgi:large subunit ribosomal protein L10